MFSISCEIYPLRTGTKNLPNRKPERIVPQDARTEIEVCIHGTTGPNLIVSNPLANRHTPDFGFAAKVVGQATPQVTQINRTADGCTDVCIRAASRPSPGGAKRHFAPKKLKGRSAALGHLPTFATPLHHVCNAPINRHSAQASAMCWTTSPL